MDISTDYILVDFREENHLLVGGTLDIGQDGDIVSYTSKACKNLLRETAYDVWEGGTDRLQALKGWCEGWRYTHLSERCDDQIISVPRG